MQPIWSEKILEEKFSGPVYITGASGFLGAEINSVFSNRGIETIGVSRHRGQAVSLLVDSYEALSVPEGSTIIHTAESNNVRLAEQSAERYHSECIANLEHLLSQPWKKFFYASSAIVYGDRHTVPVSTESPTIDKPGAYQKNKLTCEQLVLERGGIVGRFSNLIGEGMSSSNVLSEILLQLKSSNRISLESKAPIRDFLYISDAASGVLRALLNGNLPAPAIFNFGSGRATSIKELAEMTIRQSGRKNLSLEWKSDAENHSYLVLNNTATKEILGWSPSVSLSEAIQNILTKLDCE